MCERVGVRGKEPEALLALRRAGLNHVGLLGSGVEGTVANLGDGTVAKVWSDRRMSDLALLRDFYDAVYASRPPLSTVALPHILEIRDVDGTLITVEERLPGDPVWVADGTSPNHAAGRVDVLIEALTALAAVPGNPTLRVLPMPPDEPPLDPRATFESELAELVARRATRFEASVSAALPEMDALVTDTVAALHALRPAAPRLVHGDLIAANVLASGVHATADLDFGFLSTAGDPAFDAAIAASCFDMWSPSARDVERELEQAFVSAFEHDPYRYSVYRAAYAFATACCFGTDLSEGHFGWCITMLKRSDIQAAIRS